MPRKKHDDHDEHVNHEAWVIPYADLLTLLMALFLVLWAMGQTDVQRMKEVSAGFAAALGASPAGGELGAGAQDGSSTLSGTGLGTGSPPTTVAATSDNQAMANAQGILDQARQHESDVKGEQALLEQTRQQIQAQLDAKGFGDKVEMRVTPEGLVVVATDGLLFASGSAGLEAGGQSAIDAIAEPLLALTQPVRVEGHTDNTPISGTYPSNWELSTARASSVLRYLVERFGFPATRVSAAGYGDTRPAGDNATADGRAANRRVEIVVEAVKIRESVSSGADAAPSTAGASATPAPIGEDGPLGAPQNVAPAPVPGPGATTPTTTPPTEGTGHHG